MSDLVKRLRSEAVNWSASCGDLFDEAANRIEQLEAALEAALHEIESFPYVGEKAVQQMVLIARAALAPEQNK